MYLGQGIADLQLKSTIGTVKKRAKKNLLLKIGWANNRKLKTISAILQSKTNRSCPGLAVLIGLRRSSNSFFYPPMQAAALSNLVPTETGSASILPPG